VSRSIRRVSRARGQFARLGCFACALVLGAGSAHAHLGGPGPGYDPEDMVIGATAGPERRLAIRFDFTTPVRVALADVFERLTVLTGVDPGFDALTGDERLDGLRALAPDTAVELELVDDDGGRIALKLHDVLLDAPGARAPLGVQTKAPPSGLHTHAEIQLRSDAAPDAWTEARLSIRLHDAGGRYAPSDVYELLVSNGYLPAVVPNRAALACRRIVARQAGRRGASVDEVAGACDGLHAREQLTALAALVQARLAPATAAGTPCANAAATLARHARLHAHQLGRCLVALERDAVDAHAGRRIDPRRAARPCAASAAWRDGEPGLLDRLRRARRRAERRMARACPRDDGRALLESARCAGEDAVSAAFPRAKADLHTLLGPPHAIGSRLDEYFPCLRGSAAAAE